MKEWVAVLRAADAAARWHVHQRRKGAAQEPYINHLLEVASLVAEATSGNSPQVIVAALLHDAIEDQEVPRELIAQEFGRDVATLVEEVTDDKSLEKHERKRLQVDTAHKKSDDAKRIKLADKTSNLRAITFSAPPDWSVKRRLEYIRWAKALPKVRINLARSGLEPCPPALLGLRASDLVANLPVHDGVKSDRTSFEACERMLVTGSTASRGRQKKAAIRMLGNFF